MNGVLPKRLATIKRHQREGREYAWVRKLLVKVRKREMTLEQLHAIQDRNGWDRTPKNDMAVF